MENVFVNYAAANDAGSGTQESPKKLISSAWSLVDPDGTIWLRGGTPHQIATIVSNFISGVSAAARVTMRNYDDEDIEILNTGVTAGAYFTIPNNRHNIRIMGSPGHRLVINGNSDQHGGSIAGLHQGILPGWDSNTNWNDDIEIKHIEIKNVGAHGISSRSVRRMLISDYYGHHQGSRVQDHALYLNGDSRNCIMEHFIFHDNAGCPADMHNSGAGAATLVTDNIYRYGLIYNLPVPPNGGTNQGCFIGGQRNLLHHITVRNVLGDHASGKGIGIALWGRNNKAFYCNAYDCWIGFFLNSHPTEETKGEMRNCISQNNVENVNQNNIYNIQSNNLITGNPNDYLIDYANNDYRPLDNAAVAADIVGRGLFIVGIELDSDGNVIADPPDIGKYPLVIEAPPPPTGLVITAGIMTFDAPTEPLPTKFRIYKETEALKSPPEQYFEVPNDPALMKHDGTGTFNDLVDRPIRNPEVDTYYISVQPFIGDTPGDRSDEEEYIVP